MPAIFTDVLKDRKEAPGKLDFGKKKKADEMGDAPSAAGLELTNKEKRQDEDSGEEDDGEEEELELEVGDEGQSEGVSLPPSSRPSTPLSLGDGNSEHFEPLEDEMEEDR